MHDLLQTDVHYIQQPVLSLYYRCLYKRAERKSSQTRTQRIGGKKDSSSVEHQWQTRGFNFPPTSWKVFFIGLHDLPGEYTCLRLAHPMTKGETKEPQPVTNRITPRLNWSWSTTTTKKGYIYKRKTGDVATGRDYQSPPPPGKGPFSKPESPTRGLVCWRNKDTYNDLISLHAKSLNK